MSDHHLVHQSAHWETSANFPVSVFNLCFISGSTKWLRLRPSSKLAGARCGDLLVHDRSRNQNAPCSSAVISFDFGGVRGNPPGSESALKDRSPASHRPGSTGHSCRSTTALQGSWRLECLRSRLQPFRSVIADTGCSLRFFERQD